MKYWDIITVIYKVWNLWYPHEYQVVVFSISYLVFVHIIFIEPSYQYLHSLRFSLIGRSRTKALCVKSECSFISSFFEREKKWRNNFQRFSSRSLTLRVAWVWASGPANLVLCCTVCQKPSKFKLIIHFVVQFASVCFILEILNWPCFNCSYFFFCSMQRCFCSSQIQS